MDRNALHAEFNPEPQGAGGSQRKSGPLPEEKVEALRFDGAALEYAVLGGVRVEDDWEVFQIVRVDREARRRKTTLSEECLSALVRENYRPSPAHLDDERTLEAAFHFPHGRSRDGANSASGRWSGSPGGNSSFASPCRRGVATTIEAGQASMQWLDSGGRRDWPALWRGGPSPRENHQKKGKRPSLPLREPSPLG